MAEELSLSPTSLFARIEALKKWQVEQHQKMLEQQTEQSNFLSHEHKRMYQALGLQDNRDCDVDNSLGSSRDYSPDNTRNSVDLDDIPIISPKKDFDTLLQEQLRNIEVPVINNNNKPKRAFLKKGTGLSRFRMTEKDLAHKKPKPKVILPPKKICNVIKPLPKPEKTSKKRESSPKFKKPLNLTKVSTSKTREKNAETPNFSGSKKIIQPKSLWKPAQNNQNNKHSDYEALLAELMEVRQKDPSIFDTPVINNSSHEYQQLFEKELLDELKIFEVLEQNASNSSFCSTSSLMTKVLQHPIKSTPQKIPNIAELQSIGSPETGKNKRTVTFAEQERVLLNENKIETPAQSESDLDSLSDSYSSVTSDDIADMKTAPNTNTDSSCQSVKMYKDMSTNTDEPVIINSDLLKTRLADLEEEIETFRSENARVTKLKDQYEINSRNLDKRKRQLEKDFDEQKHSLQFQLDEEKNKLSKDRLIYDRYAREIKEGKSLRQKDKEELTVMRNKVAELEQELKLKESKWGATHARIRNQLRHTEKENATLRTENTELRSKNGKLEATNKQLLSRRPSDTKVLHEINKNLSKLTHPDGKQTLTSRKSLGNVEKNKKIIRNRTRSASEILNQRNNSSDIDNLLDTNKENDRNSSNSSINDSSKIDERSFYQIEQEYEKLFGAAFAEQNNEVLPAAEASYANLSARKDETVLEDGSVQVSYSNGNIKTVSADGRTIVMQYHNCDRKETFKDTGVVKYLYADANTWHTTYPDGVEVLEFSK